MKSEQKYGELLFFLTGLSVRLRCLDAAKPRHMSSYTTAGHHTRYSAYILEETTVS